jgi:pantoate--beta-alanine ligase
MQILDSIEPLQTEIARWKSQGHKIGFVPTMGDLHEGHLSLIRLAREKADRLVVSVFVNPLQFGPDEDFARYPRQLGTDAGLLENAQADLLFAPGADEMYPDGEQAVRQVSAGELGNILCGVSRSGHFDGVATAVNRLFEVVQPDLAAFGQKDYQQLLVIRGLVAEQGLPVDIYSGPICREADGLAMSTRNRYLDEKDRAVAPRLYEELRAAAALLIAGKEGAGKEGAGKEGRAQILRHSIENLAAAGFQLDYFELRRAVDLSVASEKDQELVLLAAAHLGETRLIDNLLFSL